MRTFAEGLALRDKTVLPVVTCAVGGIGSAPVVYCEACACATICDGIAVRGEEVGQAGAQVASWLESVGLH